jgi:flavin reductase (DIM6/NTAB) family NADH-FMN oxidoreductase RutF
MSVPALDHRLQPEALRRAFGSFPSGVVAVTALVDGVPVGLAASSFTSVSLDPPLVSVSVARTSTTWPVLRTAPRIGVSVLARHQAEVCRQLAGPAERRFDDLTLRTTAGGAVLLAEAASAFECSLAEELAAGDHIIALLRLHDVEDGTAAPLVFHRSKLIALGVSLPSGQPPR